MARVKSSSKTNADFERLGFKFNDIEQAMLNMSDDMGMMTSNSLLQPEPQIPFVIGEEPDVDGVFPTFAINIPQQTEVIRVQLIRKSDNVKLNTDADDASAIARARRRIFAFRFEVSEDEAQNGAVERKADKPIKRRKAAAKNQLQLIRLIALNDKDAFAKNPSDDPFKVTGTLNVGDPIFPALIVRSAYDALDSGHMPGETIMVDADKRYFNIGTSVAGPSKPALNKIVSNTINLETPQTGDVKVTFRVEANANNSGSVNDVSFEAAGYNECQIVLQRVNPDGSADAGNGPLFFGGAVEDTDATFVLIDAILPLGARIKWRRNIVGNGVKKEPATPDMDVIFFAGGQPPTAGIPELQAFTIAIGETDNGFTEVTATITQKASPNLPVLLKRLQFFKTNPAGVKKLVNKIQLLDEEGVFIAGASTSFTVQIKHKKNLTGIAFDATVIGINHTTAVPIKRDASPTMGNSTFNVKPTFPAANLITTTPDSESSEANDSFADFAVGASATDPTATFASVGTDLIYIVLRKQNTANDDDPDDNRIPKIPFPIEDANVTQVVCRVRNLKTGRQYIWRRNIASNSGALVNSDPATVAFRAGQMVLDPTNVTLSFTVTQDGNNMFLLRVSITQAPAPAMAVLLRNIIVFKDKRNGNGFREIDRAIIKDKPEFQMPGTSTIDFELFAKAGSTIDIRVRITAVGGAIKEVTQLNVLAMATMDAPTTLPSIPASGDIIANTIQSDISTGIAVVTFRVFASWMRALTGQGGTGPGGSIAFQDVLADDAAAVIVDANDSTKTQIIRAGNIDIAQNFVDITAELTVGKNYNYIRNITYRSGTPAKSTATILPFTAGGRLGTPGLPEIGSPFVTPPILELFTVVDDSGVTDKRQVDARVTFTQPSSAIFIKRIEFEKKRNADSAFKLVGGERLLDDLAYQLVGTKTFNKTIQVPASSTFNIRAILIGLGDTPSIPIRRTVGPTNIVMQAEASNNDTGRPQWGGRPATGQSVLSTTVPKMKVRWKPSGIKIKANLPDKQVKSLITCRVALEFVTQPFSSTIVGYLYNPETNAQRNSILSPFLLDTGSGGELSVLRFDSDFYIDIGKAINTFFLADRPSIMGSRPTATYLDQGILAAVPSVAADLLAAYNAFRMSYLQVRVVAINNFVPTNEQTSSIGVASGFLNFPFDGGAVDDLNTFIP